MPAWAWESSPQVSLLMHQSSVDYALLIKWSQESPMPFNFRPESNIAQGDLAKGLGTPTADVSARLSADVSAQAQAQLAGKAGMAQAFTGAEASLAQAMPIGADAGTHAAAQAACQQVSPLIQLIMKMPGHIGVLGNFFEAIGAFFSPSHELFSGFDLSTLAGHAQEAAKHVSTSLGEHGHIDLSLFPDGAPTLAHLTSMDGMGGLHSGMPHGLEKIAGHGSASSASHALSKTVLHRQLNVSGTLDFKKPQFEQEIGNNAAAGEPTISGPELSSSNPGGALSENHRLFVDKIDSVSNNALASQSVSASSASALPNNLNVGASPISQATGQAMPEISLHNEMPDLQVSGPSLSENNVGYHLGSTAPSNIDGSLGPSGAVTNELGGKTLSAPDVSQATPQTHNTFSSDTLASNPPQTDWAGGTTTTNNFASASGAGMTALKAKQLSFGKLAPKSTSTVDHIGHQAKGHAPSAKTASTNSSQSKPAMDQIAHQVRGHRSTVDAPHGNNGNPGVDHIAHQVRGHHSTVDAPHANNGNSGIDHIAHQTRGHAGGGKAVDQISHRAIEHKVGDHVSTNKVAAESVVDVPKTTPSISSIKSAIAPKAITPSYATRVDGIAQANPLATIKSSGDSTLGSNLGSYTVKSGDSLWSIATNQLGDGSRWKEIYNLNTQSLGSDPSMIHAGSKIELPGQSHDIAQAATQADKYVVQPGDNLWNIAEKHLGSGSRWGELYQANAGVIGANPRMIMPGQEISLSSTPQVASVPDTGSSLGASAQSSASSAAPSVSSSTPAPSGNPDLVSSAPMQQAQPGGPAFNMEQAMSYAGVSVAQPQAQAMAAGPGAAGAQTLASTTNLRSLRPDLSFLNRK